MAILDSTFTFTGRLGDFVAYRMRGVDGIVIRKKGGISKQRLLEDPAFTNTRRTISEFSGRSALTKRIRRGLMPLTELADYNIMGQLNKVLRPVQKLDTESALGERHVLLTREPKLLEGFSLNRKVTFDGIVRGNLVASIDRGTGVASVIIPKMVPGITLHLPDRHPYYQFICNLFIVPDLFFHPEGYRPGFQAQSIPETTSVQSRWYPSHKGSDEISLTLTLAGLPADGQFSFVLAVGIRSGRMGDNETIESIPKRGAAMIVMLR